MRRCSIHPACSLHRPILLRQLAQTAQQRRPLPAADQDPVDRVPLVLDSALVHEFRVLGAVRDREGRQSMLGIPGKSQRSAGVPVHRERGVLACEIDLVRDVPCIVTLPADLEEVRLDAADLVAAIDLEAGDPIVGDVVAVLERHPHIIRPWAVVLGA